MANLSHHTLPAFKVGFLLIVGILAGKHLPVSAITSTLVIVAFSFFLSVLLLSAVCHLRAELLTALAVCLCFVGGVLKITVDRSATPPLDAPSFKAIAVGRILDTPDIEEARMRFPLRLEALLRDSAGHSVPVNILVTIKRARADSVFPGLAYGMCVALNGQFDVPSAERNPGEFSPREYYEANSITWLMTVRGNGQVIVLDSLGGSWVTRSVVLPVRCSMLALIDSTVGGEEGEFLKGIMIGDRSGLSRATRDAFVNSGVAHVLAVSGSNVAVVASILILLFEMARFPRVIRTLAALAGVIFYMMLTGNQPSVVRATIMASVFLLAGLGQRRSNPFNAMGIAALMILLYDARQLFDIGFQLSFGAVLSIIYMYPKVNTLLRRLPTEHWWQRGAMAILQVCAVSLVASLGTLPLTATSFGRVSVIGIAANIFVIPATGFSLALGCASTFAGLLSYWLAETYAGINALVLRWTLDVIRIAGNLSIAYVDTSQFAPLDALPFYAGLFLAFHLQGRTCLRALIAFLIALNIAIFAPRPLEPMGGTENMRVSVIDVGQGDAILAECPDGRTILLDAGPAAREYDAGERVVVPYLMRRGIEAIDLLIISHPHSDHIGGVQAVLRTLPVKKVISLSDLPHPYAEMRDAAKKGGTWCDSIRAGAMVMDSAAVRLFVLYPLDSTSAAAPNSMSDNRCLVVKLQYGSVSFMFTADADAHAEMEMVTAYGPFLQSTVLKAGHHGSRTSNSQAFLDAVRPGAAVISVGRNNKFHHPSPEVVDRFCSMNVPPARTDEDGAVIYETDGRSLWRVAWR